MSTIKLVSVARSTVAVRPCMYKNACISMHVCMHVNMLGTRCIKLGNRLWVVGLAYLWLGIVIFLSINSLLTAVLHWNTSDGSTHKPQPYTTHHHAAKPSLLHLCPFQKVIHFWTRPLSDSINYYPSHDKHVRRFLTLCLLANLCCYCQPILELRPERKYGGCATGSTRCCTSKEKWAWNVCAFKKVLCIM